jgi:hypothetical protein
LAAALLQIVRDTAAALGIASELLATRRDIEAIAFGSVDLAQSPVLRGWRASILGDPIVARLSTRGTPAG